MLSISDRRISGDRRHWLEDNDAVLSKALAEDNEDGASHDGLHRKMGWIFYSRYQSQKRLDGQVAIVTGCNTGIGKCAALYLAKRGAQVVMACRSLERAEAAADDIRLSVPNARLEVMLVDLSSLESVRAFCKEFSASHTSLHILINNAGLAMNARKLTVDGFEAHFGTNYLGHFLLTLLLLPTIIKSLPARVINVSSRAHILCNSMFFEDLNLDKNFSFWCAYGRSKLANILFTKELAKRLKGQDVKVVSLHPGMVHTDIGRHFLRTTSSFYRVYRVLLKALSWLLATPEEGAQTILHCALEENVESGFYYDDCAVGKTSGLAKNSELAKELWNKSLELVGLEDFDPFSALSAE